MTRSLFKDKLSFLISSGTAEQLGELGGGGGGGGICDLKLRDTRQFFLLTL